MILRLLPRGTSFKGAAQYYLHDKRTEEEREAGVQIDTDERVAWVRTINMHLDHHEDLDRQNRELAWKMMAHTAGKADWLKQQSGQSLSGPKAHKNVITLALSPHENEAQGMSRDDYMEQSRRVMKALGAENREAMIVFHKDTDHEHAHLMINSICPETGKALGDSYEKQRLSDLGLEIELENGKIYCPNRQANREARARGDFDQVVNTHVPYHIWQERKERADERTAAAEKIKQETRARADAIKAAQREAFAEIREAEKQARRGFEERKKELEAQSRADAKARADLVFETRKPEFSELAKRQAEERKAWEAEDKKILGIAKHSLQAVRVDHGEETRRGQLRALFHATIDSQQRKAVFDRQQEAERESFKQDTRDRQKEERQRAWENTKPEREANEQRRQDKLAKIEQAKKATKIAFDRQWAKHNEQAQADWKEYRAEDDRLAFQEKLAVAERQREQHDREYTEAYFAGGEDGPQTPAQDNKARAAAAKLEKTESRCRDLRQLGADGFHAQREAEREERRRAKEAAKKDKTKEVQKDARPKEAEKNQASRPAADQQLSAKPAFNEKAPPAREQISAHQQKALEGLRATGQEETRRQRTLYEREQEWVAEDRRHDEPALKGDKQEKGQEAPTQPPSLADRFAPAATAPSFLEGLRASGQRESARKQAEREQLMQEWREADAAPEHDKQTEPRAGPQRGDTAHGFEDASTARQAEEPQQAIKARDSEQAKEAEQQPLTTHTRDDQQDREVATLRKKTPHRRRRGERTGRKRDQLKEQEDRSAASSSSGVSAEFEQAGHTEPDMAAQASREAAQAQQSAAIPQQDQTSTSQSFEEAKQRLIRHLREADRKAGERSRDRDNTDRDDDRDLGRGRERGGLER